MARNAKPSSWLFVHDHHFVQKDDYVGSRNGFGAPLWRRYLQFCDRLTVIGRQGPQAKDEDLIRASHERVDFCLVSDCGSPLGRMMGSEEQRSVLAREIAKHDVVVARIPSRLGLAAIAIARELHKPVAVEVVGCAWSAMWDHGSLAGKAFAPIHWHEMRKAVREAEHVMYVTDRYLQDRYPTLAGNVEIASNVELPATTAANGNPVLDPIILEKRIARIATMPTRPVRLGLIGSLKVRSKGIQFVLQALQGLRAEVTFHVLGAGEQKPWLAEARELGVEGMVTFHGSLPEGEAVLEWLDDIDLYLQPSLQEGLPRALIEAMSRACPAIGSKCAGIPELLDPAMIVPKRDVGALQKRISSLMEDRTELERQARCNFEAAHRYLSPALAERRKKFLSRVIKNTEANGVTCEKTVRSAQPQI